MFLNGSLRTLHLFHSHFWNKRHCDGNVHALPHFSMAQHKQTCSNRWGMAVKDKSPEFSRDLIPGDHLKIKVTVCFLPGGSICLSFWCGGFIKTQERAPVCIKAVMQCPFALESLKCFPKEQTLKHIYLTVPKAEFKKNPKLSRSKLTLCWGMGLRNHCWKCPSPSSVSTCSLPTRVPKLAQMLGNPEGEEDEDGWSYD